MRHIRPISLIRHIRLRTWVALGVLIVLAPLAFFTLYQPQTGEAAWYNQSWGFRKKITIDNTKVSGSADHTNFPILINSTIPELASLAQSDGDDILFTSADGSTKLDHEIESYTSASGKLIAWVEIPTLDYDNDTVIYMYYGNAVATTQENETGTWAGGNYVYVHHLEEGDSTTTDFYDDSTTNDLDGTLTDADADTTSVTGQIDGALDFTGDPDVDSVLVKDNALLDLNPATSYTWEFWLAPDVFTEWQSLYVADDIDIDYIQFYVHTTADTAWGAVTAGVSVGWIDSDGDKTYRHTNNSVLTAGTLAHVVVVYDSSQLQASRWRIYINGTDQTNTSDTNSSGTIDTIGTTQTEIAEGNGDLNFNGKIDEVKFSNSLRSADWIATEYNNQSSPSTFYSFGDQNTKNKPIVYWNLDEGVDNTCPGGEDACDSSGNSNDGAFGATTAAPAWQTEDKCVSGKCLLFDGTDDTVTVANTVTGVQSVSFWVKVLSTSTTQELLDLNATDYFTSVSGTVTVAGFGTDTIYVDGISGATTLTANRWHHVAVTSTTGFSASAITIGNVSTNFGNIFMDEVRLFDTALSAAQVKNEFAGGAVVFGAQDTDFLNQGLVGYWRMEEAGDATRLDSSGNGTTLTESASDTVAQVGGKFGNAGDFELGDTEYLSVADNAVLSITGSLTLSAWIRPEAVTSGTFNIIAKWGGSTDSYRLASIADGTNHEIRLELESDNNYQETTSSNLVASTFYHVVGVYDVSAATAKIYINGVEATSSTTGTIPSSITDDAGAFSLGAEDTAGTPTGYYDGYIDEARIYNRALSSGEVKALYNWAPGPVAYYNLDEGTGTSSVNDRSGNSNTTTMTGTMTAEDWVPGKFGSALDFDGNDDALTIATANDSLVNFNGGETFSGSAWVYVKTMPGSGNQDAIITKWDETSTLRGYRLIVENDDADTTGNFQIDIYDESADQTIFATGANDTVSTNTWYHIAFTFNGGVAGAAGDLKLYTNGILTNENSANTSFLGLEDVAVDFSIADYDVTDAVANNTAFTGITDEIRVYNYIRTSQQIVEDMNAGHPAGGSPIGSQVIDWHFDENAGTTAYNSVESGTNGTLNSITTPATATSGWTESGKYNGGILFDGSNDKVVIVTASDANVDFNGSEPFSLSAWIYSTTVPPTTTDEDLIIGKWDETSSLRQYRMFLENDDTDSTGHIRVEVMDESTAGNEILSAVSANDSITQNTWYHVVMTFNGTVTGAADSLKVYIDGTQRGTNSANASFLGIEELGSDFTVGDYDATDSDGDLDAFTGTIDEVQVYSGELTSDQVKIVYAANSASNFGVGTDEKATTYGGPGGNPPIRYYSFDENKDNSCTGGEDACDRSGNDYDGTFNGNATFAPGKYGSAVTLDNNGDYVDMGVTFPTTTTAFTVSAWIYPTSLTGGNEIICNSGSAYFCLYLSGNQLRFCADGTICTAEAFTNSSIFTLNQWQHIVMTYNGSNAYTFYVNGINQTSDSTTGARSEATQGSLYIGADVTGSSWFGGKVDEVKWYDYVLSSTQIQYEYNRGEPVAHWKFDECTGGTAYDNSKNANGAAGGKDGTLSGATAPNTGNGDCTTVDTATKWYNGATGKRNASLDFDDVDDIVTVTDNSVLDLTSGLSISAWVKTSADEADNVVVSKGTSYEMGADASGNLYWDGVGAQADDGSAKVTSGTWHHIVVTNDDTTVTYYVDGASTGTDAAGIDTDNATNLIIGGDGTNFFDGLIDDVRIFNYALSAKQILNIMNDGAYRWGPAEGSP